MCGGCVNETLTIRKNVHCVGLLEVATTRVGGVYKKPLAKPRPPLGSTIFFTLHVAQLLN